MRRTNLARRVRLLLEVSALTVLAAWGTYATVTISFSPSPSSPGGLASQVLQQVSISLGVSASGTIIPPSGTAYFAMDFHDKTQFNASQTYPRTHPYPGYPGVVWGQFLPSDPDSMVSAFVRHYAVFSYWVTFGGGGVASGLFGPGPYSPSSPTPHPTYLISSGVYSNGPGATNTDTGIMEADSPGNYTLYVAIGGAGNATAHVSMGFSAVTFQPLRPYFDYGIASLAILGAYLIVRLGTLPRIPKRESSQGFRTVQQPLPHDIPPD